MLLILAFQDKLINVPVSFSAHISVLITCMYAMCYSIK